MKKPKMLLVVIVGIVMLLTGLAALWLFLPAEASIPHSPSSDMRLSGLSDIRPSGPFEAASGTVVAGTCSRFDFLNPKFNVIVNNPTTSTLYYVMNDPGCTASPTVFDHFLGSGDYTYWDWLTVENVTVYITPATGVRIVGQ